MKRIFYYSGYRLTVFHWQNNQCIATYAFNPGEEGIEKFRTYLRATANTPVRILVDLIEEDFKKENVPHVGVADRKAIVTRLIERHYRKSKDFVHYKVIDREKSGRKDDVLLYSVLSNPEILDPWLKPINEEGVSVSGIWSLPLLAPRLYNKLNIESKNVLLVSQQVPSNLRQTFIKDGKFESSRSAVVNLDESTIGEYISTEVEQTIRFLSNQRHIGFDDKIEIHIVCREADLDNIKSYCSDATLRTFHYHTLNEAEETLGCNTNSVEYANGIYSHICSSLAVPLGHYGNKSLFSNFYQQLASKSLYVASALAILIATMLSFHYVSGSIVLDEEAITLRDQAHSIDRTYEKNLQKLSAKLKNAKQMQSSVLLTEKINESKIVSPQNMMIDIARILGNTGMHDTELTELQWQKTQDNKIPDKNARSNKRKAKYIDYSKSDNIKQVATIGGYILVSNTSMKHAVNKVNHIADALENHKQISTVKRAALPIDTRSDTSIHNEISAQPRSSRSVDMEQGHFELQFIMGGRQL